MFSVNSIETAKSYATEANAIKAVEKAFGAQNEGQRIFNVFMVRNAAGRFVPLIVNIDQSKCNLGQFGWAGFTAVN